MKKSIVVWQNFADILIFFEIHEIGIFVQLLMF